MEFIHTEIVIYNGVICEYGTIKHLVKNDDEVLLATPEEIKQRKYTI